MEGLLDPGLARLATRLPDSVDTIRFGMEGHWGDSEGASGEKRKPDPRNLCHPDTTEGGGNS